MVSLKTLEALNSVMVLAPVTVKLDVPSRIKAPVYGFYGGEDNRVNSTIEKSKELMESSGKTYDYEIYEGAGHGFFRAGEAKDASHANRQGRKQAWIRLEKILESL